MIVNLVKIKLQNGSKYTDMAAATKLIDKNISLARYSTDLEFATKPTNKTSSKALIVGLDSNERVLFERLKFLRLELAREINQPAFVVFSDATLLDIVAKNPTNKAEMLAVNGVGEIKYSRYGQAFLTLINNDKNSGEVNEEDPNIISGKAHYDYLIDSIEQSQRRLIVMSGWITKYVVDDIFLKLLGKKLGQGITIYIGYGCQNSRGRHKEMEGTKDVIISLKKLMKAFPSKLFIANFATHEKLLMVDDHQYVIGSANWLANKNYVNSERSVIFKNNSLVAKEAFRAIELIKQNLIS